MKAAGSLQKTAWYGLGPQENYPDSKEAVSMGVYERTVDGMGTNYAFHRKTDTGSR